MSDTLPFDNEPLGNLKTYFVYELIDPRDNKVFYVGKGKNRREDDHKSGDKDLKEQKIRDIEEAGNDVKRILIGRYDTQEEAFAVETTLIKWVYGYDNLKNIDPGRYHAFVRSHYQKIAAEYPHITGIDRERTLSVNTGEYTQGQIQQIHDNNIFEKLESIKQYLSSELTSSIVISEPNLKIPQDPHIQLTGFSEGISLILKLRLAGQECVLSYVPINNTKEAKASFVSSMQRSFGENIKLNKGNIFNSRYLLIKNDEGKPDTSNQSDLASIKRKLMLAIKLN
jgi:hypothetical protein